EQEAKASRDIAKADLEAKMKNTADARRDAVKKKAEAQYNVAKEKCDDLSGDAKDQCQKDAKAERARAESVAKK
ncbi:MAG TPA: hypothetical protein VFX05_17510, partial [Casimicrobiaceae bacterium]|nr:hypothetical protein [Casimicrobiaceae bacterium]